MQQHRHNAYVGTFTYQEEQRRHADPAGRPTGVATLPRRSPHVGLIRHAPQSAGLLDAVLPPPPSSYSSPVVTSLEMHIRAHRARQERGTGHWLWGYTPHGGAGAGATPGGVAGEDGDDDADGDDGSWETPAEDAMFSKSCPTATTWAGASLQQWGLARRLGSLQQLPRQERQQEGESQAQAQAHAQAPSQAQVPPQPDAKLVASAASPPLLFAGQAKHRASLGRVGSDRALRGLPSPAAPCSSSGVEPARDTPTPGSHASSLPRAIPGSKARAAGAGRREESEELGAEETASGAEEELSPAGVLDMHAAAAARGRSSQPATPRRPPRAHSRAPAQRGAQLRFPGSRTSACANCRQFDCCSCGIPMAAFCELGYFLQESTVAHPRKHLQFLKHVMLLA